MSQRSFRTSFANSSTAIAQPASALLTTSLRRSSSCRAPPTNTSRPSHTRIGGSSVALRVAAALAMADEPNVVLTVRHTPAWYRFQRAAACGQTKARRETQLQRWAHEATGVSHRDRTNMLKMLVCEAYRFQTQKREPRVPVKRTREHDDGGSEHRFMARCVAHVSQHISTPADLALAPPPVTPLTRHDFVELLADVDTISSMMERERTPPPATASPPPTGQPLWEHVVGELSRVHMWR